MDISVIIKEYLSGASLASLSRKYDTSAYRIKNMLLSKGVLLRTQKEQNKYSPQNQRKYEINDNFFENLNEKSAYILGFIAADGSIGKDGTIKIGLSAVDKVFLENIKEALESTYPIHEYETSKGYKVCEFSFRSTQIKKTLEKYNIINRKTYTFSFPKLLSRKLIIHFIRGYFDGDGTICLSGTAQRASLCSYRKCVLEDILDFLEKEYSIPKVNIYKREQPELYYFQYSILSAKKLYYAFYESMPELYLERKYKKFVQLFGEIESHEPVTSQAEDKIV